MSISSYIQGHLLLFQFFASKLAIFSSMPDWIQNPAKLEKKLANLADRGGSPASSASPTSPTSPASKSLILSVSTLPAETYNKAYSELAKQLRTLHKGKENLEFRYKIKRLVIHFSFCA